VGRDACATTSAGPRHAGRRPCRKSPQPRLGACTVAANGRLNAEVLGQGRCAAGSTNARDSDGRLQPVAGLLLRLGRGQERSATRVLRRRRCRSGERPPHVDAGARIRAIAQAYVHGVASHRVAALANAHVGLNVEGERFCVSSNPKQMSAVARRLCNRIPRGSSRQRQSKVARLLASESETDSAALSGDGGSRPSAPYGRIYFNDQEVFWTTARSARTPAAAPVTH
jgi:hypothetical protein